MTPELVLLTRLLDSLFGWQLTKMSGHPISFFGAIVNFKEQAPLLPMIEAAITLMDQDMDLYSSYSVHVS